MTTPGWSLGDPHTCPLSSYEHNADEPCVAYAIAHGDREFAGPPPADAHVAQPRRWRDVRPGDVFIGRDEAYWFVEVVPPHYVLRSGNRVFPEPGQARPPVDPDSTINVLVPLAERHAIEALRGGGVLDKGCTLSAPA